MQHNACTLTDTRTETINNFPFENYKITNFRLEVKKLEPPGNSLNLEKARKCLGEPILKIDDKKKLE